MKIIIMGAGQSGYELARRLVEEKHDIVLIDNKADTLKLISNQIDCMTILNEGNNLEVIKEANVKDASFFFALTNSDEVNIIACRFASNENPKIKTIAGVKNYSYSSLLEIQKSLFGIDYILNKEVETAKYVIQSIKQGAVGNPIHFGTEGFTLREMKVSHTSELCGKSIKEIRNYVFLDFIIAVVYKDHGYIIPTGDTVIEEDDIVYLFGEESVLDKLFAIDADEKKLKKILIFGATNIGVSIAESIMEYRTNIPILRNIIKKVHNITILDTDHKRCVEVSEKLPNILVLEGNISENQSGSSFSSYDIFVGASTNQEANLISALYAKTIGIKRTIAIVEKNAYIKMSSQLDIDTTISTQNSAVDTFIRIINSDYIRGLHSLFSGEVEAVEFNISAKSKIKGKMIKDIKFPKATLILFIERMRQVVIPSGAFVFEENDTIGCIGARNSIRDLQEILG